MNENLEMLPCPFCGGEPVINQNAPNGYDLKCKSCLIGVRQKVLRSSMEWLKETMIKNWNTRTAHNQPADEDEKLTDEFKKIIGEPDKGPKFPPAPTGEDKGYGREDMIVALKSGLNLADHASYTEITEADIEDFFATFTTNIYR